jgi:hypothetical protein
VWETGQDIIFQHPRPFGRDSINSILTPVVLYFNKKKDREVSLPLMASLIRLKTYFYSDKSMAMALEIARWFMIFHASFRVISSFSTRARRARSFILSTESVLYFSILFHPPFVFAW